MENAGSKGLGATLAERIRIAREQRGLSQAALGHAVGVTEKSIRRWESGADDPRLAHVMALTDQLAVPGEWLVFGTGADPFAEAA